MLSKKFEYFIVGTICCLAIELTLWVCHYPLNKEKTENLPGTKITNPKLGWIHRPGTYAFLGPKDNKPFRVTYLEDGSRITQAKRNFSNRSTFLLGCSYVEGFGLGDKDTLGWKLQAKLPQINVINLGTGGYGTLQSFLRLKDYMKQTGNRPEIIIYGFADFHIFRNIKNPLSNRYVKEPGIYPYCDGTSCKVWTGKRTLFLGRFSRVVSLLENLVDNIKVMRQKENAKKITLRLIQDMQQTAKEIDAHFIAVNIEEDHDKWAERFKENNIPFVDCYRHDFSAKEYRLADNHPNSRMSEELANCIAETIQKLPPAK